jgi:hypothetical protein
MTSETEQVVAQALRGQLPLKGLPGVSIQNVREQPEQPFDISFELLSGPNRILVLGEIKSAFSPRLLEEIGPWIRRLKSLRADVAVAVIAPLLSPQAQAFCIENGIDFLDLAGNVFINVPGKFTLQRNGMRARGGFGTPSASARLANVFSGRFSRVLRVLLEQPRPWTVTEIARELAAESTRFTGRYPGAGVDFKISQGSISKAVAGLEEQLAVRRRGTAVIVPEPRRLLEQWAEKYKERYRWRLRSSFQTGNPFGSELAAIASGVGPLIQGPYAFSGAMATTRDAPFIDIDVVDVFVLNGEVGAKLRELNSQGKASAALGDGIGFRDGSGYGFGSGSGGGLADGSGYGSGLKPMLRFITPYDAGVFMYSKLVGTAPVVSPIQAYLDLYARGGRDLKQAEYLLNNIIQPHWRSA